MLALRLRATLQPKLVLALAAAGASYVPWLEVLRAQVANAERALWWMQGYWSPWNPVFSLAGYVPLGRAFPFTDLLATSAPWWIAVLGAWLALGGAQTQRVVGRRGCFENEMASSSVMNLLEATAPSQS